MDRANYGGLSSKYLNKDTLKRHYKEVVQFDAMLDYYKDYPCCKVVLKMLKREDPFPYDIFGRCFLSVGCIHEVVNGLLHTFTDDGCWGVSKRDKDIFLGAAAFQYVVAPNATEEEVPILLEEFQELMEMQWEFEDLFAKGKANSWTHSRNLQSKMKQIYERGDEDE